MTQIREIGGLIARYQIEEIKLTGGEPLLHPDILEIIHTFKSIPSVKDISLTTNGLLLDKMAGPLKSAGLQRINIGCDTINKSSVKSLNNIYSSIIATKNAGFSPIKLNMVLLKGINDTSIEDMVQYTQNEGIDLQIIELINTDDEFYRQYHVDLAVAEQILLPRTKRIVTKPMNDRKQFYLDENYYVELVRPMENHHFCANCHTLRISHDYHFQPCLNREDNLVPIGNNIEFAFQEALKRRMPFYVCTQKR